ncbi:MAG: biopolymer transporter ExbD [Planctomycetota bacterium]
MRTVRRHDHSPRVEMMPLIDVVFLLLTFFIYAMVVMVELKSSGVELLSVEGASQATSEPFVLLEIDGSGVVWIEGVQVADDELDGRLRELAGRADVPAVGVALQNVPASVDRGFVYQRLLKRITDAGITQISLPELDGGPGVLP